MYTFEKFHCRCIFSFINLIKAFFWCILIHIIIFQGTLTFLKNMKIDDIFQRNKTNFEEADKAKEQLDKILFEFKYSKEKANIDNSVENQTKPTETMAGKDVSME